jgi:short-subunit dehydrogenase
MINWIMITGASGGLGKAFAVEAARRGWNIYLTDLHAESLEVLASGLRRTYSVRVRCQACDLAEAARRAAFLEQLRRENLRFWGLINVAGVDFEGEFCQRTGEEIRAIVRVNIEANLEMTRAIVERRDPMTTFRIINVGSLAGFFPMPVKATYAASKRFLLDFSTAMNEELRGQGITTTILSPAGQPTTEGSLRGIEAQGLLGQLTTQNIGSVAADTLDKALKGAPLYIPGFLNRLLWVFGGLIPPRLLARLIGRRWREAGASDGAMRNHHLRSGRAQPFFKLFSGFRWKSLWRPAGLSRRFSKALGTFARS